MYQDDVFDLRYFYFDVIRELRTVNDIYHFSCVNKQLHAVLSDYMRLRHLAQQTHIDVSEATNLLHGFDNDCSQLLLILSQFRDYQDAATPENLVQLQVSLYKLDDTIFTSQKRENALITHINMVLAYKTLTRFLNGDLNHVNPQLFFPSDFSDNRLLFRFRTTANINIFPEKLYTLENAKHLDVLLRIINAAFNLCEATARYDNRLGLCLEIILFRLFDNDFYFTYQGLENVLYYIEPFEPNRISSFIQRCFPSASDNITPIVSTNYDFGVTMQFMANIVLSSNVLFDCTKQFMLLFPHFYLYALNGDLPLESELSELFIQLTHFEVGKINQLLSSVPSALMIECALSYKNRVFNELLVSDAFMQLSDKNKILQDLSAFWEANTIGLEDEFNCDALLAQPAAFLKLLEQVPEMFSRFDSVILDVAGFCEYADFWVTASGKALLNELQSEYFEILGDDFSRVNWWQQFLNCVVKNYQLFVGEASILKIAELVHAFKVEPTRYDYFIHRADTMSHYTEEQIHTILNIRRDEGAPKQRYEVFSSHVLLLFLSDFRTRHLSYQDLHLLAQAIEQEPAQLQHVYAHQNSHLLYDKIGLQDLVQLCGMRLASGETALERLGMLSHEELLFVTADYNDAQTLCMKLVSMPQRPEHAPKRQRLQLSLTIPDLYCSDDFDMSEEDTPGLDYRPSH